MKTEEKIPGGLGKNLKGSMKQQHKQIAMMHGVDVSKIDSEVSKGIKIEMEHTTDKDIAHEIAMDHVIEDPEYYTKLSKTELEERKKKRKKRKKAGTESSKENNLRDWFKRKGAKGKKGGWVDCNSPDGKGGYKACGREKGEKRKKYPACRPTPGACKERGRGKSWGKKGSKRRRKNESMEITNEELKKIILEELQNVLDEKKGKKRIRKKKAKKDACYRKVKSRYDVWPSAYASGALSKCRKVGAENWGNSKKNETISESLRYHMDHGVGVERNVFRPGSSEFFGVFREARQLFREGKYKLHSEEEREIIESDLGEFGLYEGMEVPLDFPMVMEQDEMEFLDEKKKKVKKKDPPLNKPMKNTGGGKKWKVYVRSKSGGIKKVTYGDAKGGLKGNWNNAEARASFAARHNCADKKDKTTSGYWACRAHKDFGTNVPGRFW
jgi:hypothetical protein